MTSNLTHYLLGLKEAAAQGLFNELKRGIEKEALRTTPTGEISQTGHPKALGSTLTHPYITTDYSEALVEFITPVNTSREETLNFLLDLHAFSLANLEQNELLWPASMPCKLDGNSSVPIAKYGTSNVGYMKEVYRQGLDTRYGRIMQSIAGIHYNLSFPEQLWELIAQLDGRPEIHTDKDWRSQKYFGLIRNFRRHSWLLMYLFGASPVADASFIAGLKNHPLTELAANTWGDSYATSLRMSDLGYQNQVQASLNICFNSIENYINTLQEAIDNPYPDYAKIGVKVGTEYRQLNTGILQIENEYYSDIRPKRVALAGEKPNQALRRAGVEYIEVRCLDINPLLTGGLDVEQMYFLDAFLLFCLLEPSPQLSQEACDKLKVNLQQSVNAGRAPNSLISQQPLLTQAQLLLERLLPVCELLDAADSEAAKFTNSWRNQLAKVKDPSLTPSAQVLKLSLEEGGFVPAMLKLAKEQLSSLTSRPINKERQESLNKLSVQSLAKQAALEAEEQIDFDTFLANYFAS